MLKIDNYFWSKVLSDGENSFQRVNKSYVIDKFEDKPVSELISKVIVPAAAYDKATEVFGDKVVIGD